MPDILHIVHDEKFVAAAEYIFNQAYPGSNTFFIIGASGDQLKYVDPNKQNYELFDDSLKSLDSISNRVGHFELVVLHWLDEFKCKLILRSPSEIKFLWMFWGGEIYDDEEIYPFTTIGKETRRLLGRDSSYNKVRQAYKKVKRKLFGLRICRSLKLDAIAALPLVGISDLAEAAYFKSLNILQEHTKPVRFYYYTADKLGPEVAPSKERKDILVGNSAAFTNNHLEIFQLLAKSGVSDQKVIVPLGYSDNDGYSAKLVTEGRRLLGENFTPLLGYVDLETYQRKIACCGYAMFNHYRQQAVGTILMCLNMGLKVFLNPEGRNYQFLQNLGFHLFSLPDISKNPLLLCTPLSSLHAHENRVLIGDSCSLSTIVRNLKNDLDNYLFLNPKKIVLQ